MKFKNVADFDSDQPSALSGAYQHVENQAYHSMSEYTSRSDLELIQRSPKHYRYAKENPQPRSEAMKIGEWVHTLVLEPENFKTEFYNEQEIIDEVMIRRPEVKTVRGTKDYKERVQELTSNGHTILKEDDMIMLQNIQAAVTENPLFQAIMQEGVPELSCFAPIMGHNCRARPDFTSFKRNFIIDLKTTQNAHNVKFIDTIYNYGYHRQAAFYMDVVSAATGVPIQGYGIVAVEKEPPYGVCCYTMSSDFIGIGRAEYKENLEKLIEATKTNQWPGYPHEFIEAHPKPWMYYRTEEA